MMSWRSAMEVDDLVCSNQHAYNARAVPTMRCKCPLHAHVHACKSPSHAEPSPSLSLAPKVPSGGWNQSTPPRSKGSPKRTTQRVAPREEKRRRVLMWLRLMGKGKDPHGWNLKRHGSGLPHGTWSACLGGTKSPRCLGRTKQ